MIMRGPGQGYCRCRPVQESSRARSCTTLISRLWRKSVSSRTTARALGGATTFPLLNLNGRLRTPRKTPIPVSGRRYRRKGRSGGPQFCAKNLRKTSPPAHVWDRGSRIEPYTRTHTIHSGKVTVLVPARRARAALPSHSSHTRPVVRDTLRFSRI